MPQHKQLAMRVLITVTAATALCLGSAVATPLAWAHVHATSDNAVRGGYAIVTFSVPNESETGSATTGLTVLLPDVASARAEAIPGWLATLDRDAAVGTVRSVTWKAVPNGGILADQFGLFRISMKLPDTATVSLPATQTYSDGTAVKWDQPSLAGGGEPEHPAPTLTLAAEPESAAGQHTPAVEASLSADPRASESDQTKAPSDNSARLLAGVALLVGALGVGIALARRRT